MHQNQPNRQFGAAPTVAPTSSAGDLATSSGPFHLDLTDEGALFSGGKPER